MSPRNAAKGLKARRMWALYNTNDALVLTLNSKRNAELYALKGNTIKPVTVINSSPSDLASMREKADEVVGLTMARLISQYQTRNLPHTGRAQQEIANAVLAALGLTARTAQGRRK